MSCFLAKPVTPCALVYDLRWTVTDRDGRDRGREYDRDRNDRDRDDRRDRDRGGRRTERDEEEAPIDPEKEAQLLAALEQDSSDEEVRPICWVLQTPSQGPVANIRGIEKAAMPRQANGHLRRGRQSSSLQPYAWANAAACFAYWVLPAISVQTLPSETQTLAGAVRE